MESKTKGKILTGLLILWMATATYLLGDYSLFLLGNTGEEISIGEWRCVKYIVKDGYSQRHNTHHNIDGFSVVVVDETALWCVIPKMIDEKDGKMKFPMCWSFAEDNDELDCKEWNWRKIKK